MQNADPIPQPLTGYSVGAIVRVSFLAMDQAEEKRLQDLGIREGNDIQIMKNDDAIVLRVEASRIAIRREVAMKIFGISDEQ